jgi:hypothetical protein
VHARPECPARKTCKPDEAQTRDHVCFADDCKITLATPGMSIGLRDSMSDNSRWSKKMSGVADRKTSG